MKTLNERLGGRSLLDSNKIVYSWMIASAIALLLIIAFANARVITVHYKSNDGTQATPGNYDINFSIHGTNVCSASAVFQNFYFPQNQTDYAGENSFNLNLTSPSIDYQNLWVKGWENGTALNCDQWNPPLTAWNVVNVNNESLNSSDDFTMNNLNLFNLTGSLVSANISTQLIDFDTMNNYSFQEGRMHWNDVDKTLDLDMEAAGVTLQMGQEMHMRVRNNRTTQIDNGQVVYVMGVQGDRAKVDLAIANSTTTSRMVGIATRNISSGSNGYVTTFGLVRDVDTSGFTAGDMLFLSDTVPGGFTKTSPTAPSFAIMVGNVIKVSADEGSILVHVGSTDMTNDMVIHNWSVNNDVRVNDELFVGNVRFTNESSNGLWNGSLHVYPTNSSEGQLLFAVEGIGASGVLMPHFWVQNGGSSLASGVSRSFMIVNEAFTLQNSTNISNCGSYMAWANETLQIDCNTTTTGADLLVGDDLQAVGEVWLKDSENEWHIINRFLQLMDELTNNIVFNLASGIFNDGNVTLTSLDNRTMVVNLNKTNTDLNVFNETIALTYGGEGSPVKNFINYQNAQNPTLTITTSHPDVDHADMGRMILGQQGNVYASVIGSERVDQFVTRITHHLFEQGLLYNNGFNVTIDSDNIAIGTGTYDIVGDETTTTNSVDSDASYFFIYNNGTYHQGTGLDDFTEYADGTSIGATKFFNVVWGLVRNDTTTARLIAIVQDYPGSSGDEYKTVDAAEADKFDKLNIFSNDGLINNIMLPIARTVVDNNGDNFETLANGEFWKDIRGTVTAGGATPPSPAVTDHGVLTGSEDDDHLQYVLRNGTRGMNRTWFTDLNITGGLFTSKSSGFSLNVSDLLLVDVTNSLVVVNGNLNISGGVNISGGLNVSDVLKVSDWVYFDSNLTVVNSVVFNNNLSVTNDVVANAFYGDLNWSFLNAYPSSCPYGSYVVGVGDTLDCSAITPGNLTSDLWVNESGDIMTGNLEVQAGVNITGPLTVTDSSGISLNVSNKLFLNATSGYVGIGTARPTQNLNVIGTGNFTGTVFGSEFRGKIVAITTSGDAIFGQTSDATAYSGQFTGGRGVYVNDNLNVTNNITLVGDVIIDCPVNFTSIEAAGRQLGCMQTVEEGNANWDTAVDDCFDTYGARLPFASEWSISMNNFALQNETSGLEWMSDYCVRADAIYTAHGVIGNGDITTENCAADTGNWEYRCFIPS